MTVWMKITKQLGSKGATTAQEPKSVEVELKSEITYEKAIELAKQIKNSCDTFTKVELRQERTEDIKGDVTA